MKRSKSRCSRQIFGVFRTNLAQIFSFSAASAGTFVTCPSSLPPDSSSFTFQAMFLSTIFCFLVINCLFACLMTSEFRQCRIPSQTGVIAGVMLSHTQTTDRGKTSNRYDMDPFRTMHIAIYCTARSALSSESREQSQLRYSCEPSRWKRRQSILQVSCQNEPIASLSSTFH